MTHDSTDLTRFKREVQAFNQCFAAITKRNATCFQHRFCSLCNRQDALAGQDINNRHPHQRRNSHGEQAGPECAERGEVIFRTDRFIRQCLGGAEDTVQEVTASASTAVCAMFRSIWGHPPRKDVSNHWQVFWLMVVDTHRLPKMISYGRQPDRFSGIKACINHLQLRAQLRIC